MLNLESLAAVDRLYELMERLDCHQPAFSEAFRILKV